MNTAVWCRRHPGHLPGQRPARPASPRLENPVQLGPKDAMGYRRPPVTVSFDDLSQRGLPRMLFVNGSLPEGMTACDINAFAAMIKVAYQEGALRFVRQDELGNDQCVGLGGTGIWQWWVVRAGKPINGERYAAPNQGICRILFGPEKDGERGVHRGPQRAPRAQTGRRQPDYVHDQDPRGVPGVPGARCGRRQPGRRGRGRRHGTDLAVRRFPGRRRAAAAADVPASPNPYRCRACCFAGQGAVLPGPEAAALIGPLLGNPAAVSAVRGYLGANSVVRLIPGMRHQVHPLARAAVLAQLTAEESAHWQQAAAALVEAAAAASPKILLPYARSVLGPANGQPEHSGMAEDTRRLGTTCAA